MARLNRNGSLDTNFLYSVSGLDNSVLCLAIQADGRILIGGSFVSVNGEPRNHLARLNSDGTLAHTFQQGMIGANDWVRSMVVQPDGKIVLVGSFTLVNSTVRNRIARLLPDGSLDETFLDGLGGADDCLLIGGRFSMVNGELRERVALLYGDEQDAVPVITMPPASHVANQGASVVFSVVAVGSNPLQYQWIKDGSPISGATNGGILLTNLQPADAGNYAVTVSNPFGTTNSIPASLVVHLPPVITAHPASLVVTQEQNASFAVTATGASPLTYQWRWNGLAIEGATNADLFFTGVQPAQAGNYSVVVSNDFGRATSRLALLTVFPHPPLTIVPGGLGFAAGHFGFAITGHSGQVVLIEASSNLQTWTPIWTNTIGSGSLPFNDPTSQINASRFYRVREP